MIFDWQWWSDGTVRVIELRSRKISRPLSRMMAEMWAEGLQREQRAGRAESVQNMMSELNMA